MRSLRAGLESCDGDILFLVLIASPQSLVQLRIILLSIKMSEMEDVVDVVVRM